MNRITGQSAIEYLMTYGWMLLVVAIVGGAVFSVVGGQGIESVSGFSGGDDVQVKDFGLTEDSLQFSLSNGGAEEVKIERIVFNDSSISVRREIKSLKNLEVGSSESIELKGVEQSDNSESHDVRVFYSTDGLSNLTVSGTVTGSFNVFNHVDLTGASFNRSTDELQITVENAGDTATDSIIYVVSANGSEFTGSLPNLEPDETDKINVSTDDAFALESVDLDTDGPQFINSESGLKCAPTKGLVGYWPLNSEQKSGMNTEDVSGKFNEGEADSVNLTDEGFVGEAYQFGPESRGRIKIDDDVSLNPNEELTISTWVKSHDLVSPKSQVFVDKGADKFAKSYTLRFHGWGPGIRMRVGNGTSTCQTSPWGQTLENEEWYHVSGVFDSGEITVFRDSEVIDRQSCEFSNIAGSDYPLSLGRRTDWRFGYLNGTLDEFRLYNRSLSQEEIRRLNEVRSKNWAVNSCKLSD